MTEPGFAAQLAEDLSPQDLRHVLKVFRADVLRMTEALSVAAGAGDVATFRRVAHGLAGAAGAVGATKLEEACRLAMTRAQLDLASAAAEIKALGAAVLVQVRDFVPE